MKPEIAITRARATTPRAAAVAGMLWANLKGQTGEAAIAGLD
jgi:hypothetical protein